MVRELNFTIPEMSFTVPFVAELYKNVQIHKCKRDPEMFLVAKVREMILVSTVDDRKNTSSLFYGRKLK